MAKSSPKETKAMYKTLKLGSLIIAAMTFLGAATTNAKDNSPADRRDILLKLDPNKKENFATLRKALRDENQIVRLTALRIISGINTIQSYACLQALLIDTDPMIRMSALQGLCIMKGKDLSLDVLEKTIADEDKNVRLLAVSNLASVKPATGKRLELLQNVVKTEKDAKIRMIADNATWPFYRNTVLLKDRPDWDHEVKLLQEIELPKTEWLLGIDKSKNGHLNNWFKPEFNATGWKQVEIGKTWDDCGVKHSGIAWYRKSIKMPDKPKSFNAAELHFGSVDECAWVWLNGVYIGQHNLGTAGWNIPFALDITQDIKWGEENVIVIRVQNQAGVGGIYKPVTLQILE